MEDEYEQLTVAFDNLNYSDEENEGDEPPPGYFIELDPIDDEIENEEDFFDLNDIDIDIDVHILIKGKWIVVKL